MAEPRFLLEEADRAVSAGDLAEARRLLREGAESSQNDPGPWLRLAGICRATGETDEALEATERALSLAPLDFTALLLRASLLDRLGKPEAAVAWSHALAQKPDGDLPPQLAQVVAQAEARVEAWVQAREQRMKQAMAGPKEEASPLQRRDLERFRSNVLRRTRHFHSESTHFHYPGLAEREFHPRDPFPWLDELEAATDTIQSELEEVMRGERAELVPYVSYPDHMPLDQWRTLNNNIDWSAIHLFKNGERVETNARHCPRTLDILLKCDQPRIPGASPNSMFSLLAANTGIPAHVGVTNARLVCHLPLIVPNGCWFRVGAETRHWRRGEAFVFDDTIEHEAMNSTDELRIILIFDVWNPQLSPVEREAVAALIASEGGLPAEGL